jgi:Ca2+-binding RTX toxin-like protein
MDDTFSFSGYRDQAIVASTAGDTWIVKKRADVTVANGAAIDASTPALDRTFVIQGLVNGLNGDGVLIGTAGHETLSEDNVVVVGRTGDIFGSGTGAAFYADRFTLVNHGKIAGNFGVAGEGDNAFIRNTGIISGAHSGIFVTGESAVVVNGRHGFIQAEHAWAVELKGDESGMLNRGEVFQAGDTSAAVFLNSAIGDVQWLTNKGLIQGDIAVLANFGDDVVTNKGDVIGEVRLGDGADVFVNDGGWVDGVINGGRGDDTYIVDRSSLDLKENAGEGTDHVHSTVSFVLGENFEQLILDGGAWINGTGNDGDNAIYGNAGRNRLSGLGGNDLLAGLGGNDWLTGGAGVDTFAFTGSGIDRIMDFVNGEDLLRIDVDGVDDFDDIKLLMRESGDNVIIETGHRDRLVIMDTSLSDIDATDFRYV